MIEPEVAYCDLDGLLELAENFLSPHRPERPQESRRRARKSSAATSRSSKAILPPFPRLRYDEAVEMLNEAHKRRPARSSPSNTATTSALPTKPGSAASSTGPVMVHRYPADVKAFYMEPDPERLALRSLRRRACARRLRRNHRRLAARLQLRAAQEPHRSSTTCPSKPSSGISTCAATARCPTPASAWASSAPSPGSAASTTSAKPSPSPAPCTASTRRRSSTAADSHRLFHSTFNELAC